MITAKQARNNMEFSLEGLLEKLEIQIVIRSKKNFDSMVAYGIPEGLVDGVISALENNEFEVTEVGNNTLEIRWG